MPRAGATRAAFAITLAEDGFVIVKHEQFWTARRRVSYEDVAWFRGNLLVENMGAMEADIQTWTCKP